jgi:phenylpyruvate tautomerase PptA (4-oxalocrotonate tautomerase family)
LFQLKKEEYMPKMFVHSRQGTFTAEARARVAAALTDLGIACERLADTPRVRAGVWVFFTEHEPDAVFSGGKVSLQPQIAMIAYTIEGGLDDESKQKLIKDATAILVEHAGLAGDRVPVFVVVRQVPEVNWGMYGQQVNLAALRTT